MSALTWLRSFFTPREIVLVCMRYSDMALVHPEQILKPCAECGCTCGVYPSGQAAMAQFGERLKIVCQVCAPPGHARLAPGAASEPRESVPR